MVKRKTRRRRVASSGRTQGAKIYCRYKKVGGKGKVVRFCVGGRTKNQYQRSRARRMNRNRSTGIAKGLKAYGKRGLRSDRPVGRVNKDKPPSKKYTVIKSFKRPTGGGFRRRYIKSRKRLQRKGLTAQLKEGRRRRKAMREMAVRRLRARPLMKAIRKRRGKPKSRNMKGMIAQRSGPGSLRSLYAGIYRKPGRNAYQRARYVSQAMGSFRQYAPGRQKAVPIAERISRANRANRARRGERDPPKARRLGKKVVIRRSRGGLSRKRPR